MHLDLHKSRLKWPQILHVCVKSTFSAIPTLTAHSKLKCKSKKKRDRRHVPSCCFFLEKHIISTKAFLSISTQQCIIKSQKTYQDDNKRDAFTLYSASQNHLYFWHWGNHSGQICNEWAKFTFLMIFGQKKIKYQSGQNRQSVRNV